MACVCGKFKESRILFIEISNGPVDYSFSTAIWHVKHHQTYTKGKKNGPVTNRATAGAGKVDDYFIGVVFSIIRPLAEAVRAELL